MDARGGMSPHKGYVGLEVRRAAYTIYDMEHTARSDAVYGR